MICFRNVLTLEGKRQDLELPSEHTFVCEGSDLTWIPALIDPHVHFRTPGLEHKENWCTGARAAIKGGITTVLDMPNTLPPSITLQRLREKKTLIERQLDEVDIPLRFGLYLGADKDHFEEIPQCKEAAVAIKVFMGSSTGGLVMDDQESLEAVFAAGHTYDLLVAVHAEEESLLQERRVLFGICHPRLHSCIRSPEVAYLATEKAITLSRKYGTRLYLLHISTKEEVALIRAAKREGLAVFAETTPHHLFLTEDAYELLGTKVQANPPIRRAEDSAALWEALRDGTIDCIGSDHAPHTLEEKNLPYGQAPSGIPGIETTLPLLLDAVNRGYLTLSLLVQLMKSNVEKIFRLPSHQDGVLLNMWRKKRIDEGTLATKCGWSPYAGRILQGWPVYTFLKGRVYDAEKASPLVSTASSLV